MTNKLQGKNAFYIDTYAQGSYHEMFNSSLILMCSLIFDKVECRLSKSSFEAFKNLIGEAVPHNINYQDVFVIKGQGRYDLLFRYLFSTFQNMRYLIAVPKDSVLIFPYNNLFSLRVLNFFNKIFKKKILIFCHGEMEGIVTDLKVGGFLHRMLIRLSQDFFLNPNVTISDGIHFSIMGERIHKNLAEILSRDKISKFVSIDHSYIFKSTEEVNLKEKDKLLRIGTVGLLNETKGMMGFIEFVNKINPLYKQKLNISVTGKIEKNAQLLSSLGIDIAPQDQIISRNEYNKRIEDLDILLFFYPKDSYKITASGAIMDAIFQRKTILALHNDYFEYVFDKFGKFGYLVNSIAEMENLLYQLIDTKENINVEFDTLQEKFSPQVISLQLLSELRRIGYLNS
ncbi:hypothetical protein AB3G33_06965 [Flavobacterium sp. WC2421]|uniref:Glycosyltransferase n=1 Tax=Flavobacterium sp. WC2409 TaxID=3234139 RepID=A0AB39W1G6_9FLAO